MIPAEWMEQDERATPTERIERAAILFEGRVFSVPQPGRHHHVMYKIMGRLLIGEIRGEIQGFVTSTGRFVNREEAMQIARKAGQLIKPTFQPDVLFSEDLW